MNILYINLKDIDINIWVQYTEWFTMRMPTTIFPLIIHLFKYWLLELLNTLRDHYFNVYIINLLACSHSLMGSVFVGS